jgi:hypothetical protein
VAEVRTRVTTLVGDRPVGRPAEGREDFAEVTKKDLGGDGEKEVCLSEKSGKIEISG